MAWGAALTLIVIVLVLTLVARTVIARFDERFDEHGPANQQLRGP